MNIKIIVIVSALLLGFSLMEARAQTKYHIIKSKVSFFSAAALENIDATSSEAKGIIDASARTFFVKIPIKSFKFKSDLMKEHFNENYMESEKYPDATFKGNIEGNFNLQVDGSYPVNAAGDLTIHGVTQKRTIPCTLTVKNGVPSLNSKFDVKLADHKIEIPTLVFNKIAEVVEVRIDATLGKM